MQRVLPILILWFLLIAPALAEQDAIVVRTATVFAQASAASARVGRLEAGTRVSLFSRKGGWEEIYSAEKAIIGWMRSYQVRAGNYAPVIQGEAQTDERGFLAGLASFSRRASRYFDAPSGGTSSATATIGVRGLSEMEIRSAVADFEQRKKMNRFASNPKRASRFADRGGLKARQIAHIAGAE